MSTAIVSGKRQVVLPADLCRQLAIKPPVAAPGKQSGQCLSGCDVKPGVHGFPERR
ncbi:MAG: hypothetical protein KGZ31_03975 [Sulfuritalea sp.]|nr:hypothetical protein [Sulfuritalea sp.]